MYIFCGIDAEGKVLVNTDGVTKAIELTDVQLDKLNELDLSIGSSFHIDDSDELQVDTDAKPDKAKSKTGSSPAPGIAINLNYL